MPSLFDDPNLTYRASMLPMGTYRNPDGSESLGFAVPGMISEPVNALYRLAQNSVLPDGRLGIPNPENVQNQQDVVTGLLSLYGGNALGRGVASEGVRDAAQAGYRTLRHPGEPSAIDPSTTFAYFPIEIAEDWRLPGTPANSNLAHHIIQSRMDTVYDPQTPSLSDVAGDNIPGPFDQGYFNALIRQRQVKDGELLSDTGRPSLLGSTIAGFEKAKAPDRSLGPFGGSPSEEGAVLPKAEAIGTPNSAFLPKRLEHPRTFSLATSAPRSKVLAENGVTEADRIKAAEDAYVKGFRNDIESNAGRYFTDWKEGEPVFDERGNIVDIPRFSEALENASPYGYAPLKNAPPSATAAGLNAAAQAVDRDLFLSRSSNSNSHYGTLRTPSGREYKVRVADHPQISSQFDPPDFNIAPGNMTPEEFARLLPTLLSDTGRPSLFGSAVAGQNDPRFNSLLTY